MKTHIHTLAAALMLAAAPLAAQPAIVLDTDHTFGGSAGPSIRLGSLFGQTAMLGGAEITIIVDRRWSAGIAGATLCNDVTIHPTPLSTATLRLLYGGLVVAHALGDGPVHPVVRLTVGGGGARAIDQRAIDLPGSAMILDVEFPVDGPDDAFFVLEPGVGIEALIGDYTRLELGALYRLVGGLTEPAITNGDISGLSVALTAKVGVW